MKTLIFASIVIFFTSCGKIEIDTSGWSSGWGSGYGWGSFTPIPDSNNIVKADIDSAGTIYHLSAVAFNANFGSWVKSLYTDSSSVMINGYNEKFNLQIELVNILAPGSYSFGHTPGIGREVKASCSIGGIEYLNNYNIISGSIKIDTLTEKKIQGSFNVKCWNGTNSINITNGSFVGKFY